MIRFVTTWARLLCLAACLTGMSASGLRAQDASVSSLEGDPWLDALTYELLQHFGAEGELSLEWARQRPAEASTPVELKVVAFPASLSPQMALRIRASTTSGPVEHTVIVRAQLWRDGWTVREPSVRGETVSPSSLEPMRFDALRDRDAITATDDLDLVYSRAIPAGRLLSWRDVARRPLVRRGQLIEVAATDGPLTVTLRAVALADAGRGEVVRVRNPDSRKEFTAQVVSDARAQVRF